MITRKEDAWIENFIPQYSPKGKKLYHRKSSLTPLQRVTSDFFERLREEGTIASESTVMGFHDGFAVSFMERDGKYKGLAYRQHLGKDIEIETPWCPTRRDADGILNQYIKAFNK